VSGILFGLVLLQTTKAESLTSLAAIDQFRVDCIKRPLEWHGNDYIVRENPAKASLLEAYEALFVKEFSLYPASFVEKAVVHRIVFGAGLSVDGQVRAAVPAFDGETMYYDAVLGASKPHYQRLVIHHEFFHMVDQRMGFLDRDPEWEKLNAPGFRYGPGGANMRRKGVGDLTDKIPGFLTMYGTAAVEEDKAELFAHMIVDGPYVKKRASQDAVLAAKIGLLDKRLAAFDPAMGTSFWKKITGWTK